jgi:hypothetical protein
MKALFFPSFHLTNQVNFFYISWPSVANFYTSEKKEISSLRLLPVKTNVLAATFALHHPAASSLLFSSRRLSPVP